MTFTVGINGACGRMGQRLIVLAQEDPDFKVGAALEAVGHPQIGRDAGEVAGVGPIGVMVTSSVPGRLDVLIDFSTPEGTLAILPACVRSRLPIVVATTGFSAEQRREVEAAAHETAVLLSPNLSLVVNVLFQLARQAGLALKGKGFDVEIVEQHHRFKKDSPSGTAMQFARIIQEAMGQTELRHGREGLVGERLSHEIGIHAIRAGDNTGEHTILFSALGESLELVHRSTSRDSYARGALEAAKFLTGKPAGRYGMADVLGLTE